MTDREVKKANRDLQNLLQSMDGPISKMETVQRKYSELLAEMKRTEREHIKAKKRGDQLQKDKDTQRSELTKANSMKEKLEKLSRELTKENKKLKVRKCCMFYGDAVY
jgi:poly-D-alanine transfer protein DltD